MTVGGSTGTYVESAATGLAGGRIMVIGDVMVDVAINGNVERISPEANVPVVSAVSTATTLGGAGNVARQLRALHVQVDLVGAVGADADAETIRRLCRSDGIDSGSLVTDVARVTTRKSRIASGQRHLLRIDYETVSPLAGAAEVAILAALRRAEPADVIVLSDYGKGVLSDSVIAAAHDRAEVWGAPVLVDPTYRPLSDYGNVELIKLNRPEFEALAGEGLGAEPERALADVAPAVLAASGARSLVVTLGDRGLVLVGPSGIEHLSAVPVDAQDVSGAGDTVMAVLAAARSHDIALDVAIGIANAAGSLVVGRWGVVTTCLPELVQCLSGRTPAPVVDLDGLRRLNGEWRGNRVAFTNGCFDLFHPGHMEVLRVAALHADAIVVGVDTDASVRRLKGPQRPVIGEIERAELIAAIPGVSVVVLFESEQLPEIIDAVRPDVLLKGDDYQLIDVVGADAVAGWGGETVLVTRIPGFSTTALLDPQRTAGPRRPDIGRRDPEPSSRRHDGPLLG